ncbi:MAG: DUF3253 domain-containing protein [Burkholderiaceae bacterium]|nr:DUF3253 domain-containing protein [Burkholderiaceae bacterium]
MSSRHSEQASPAQDRERIAQTILALLAARAAGASICPSEVARALAPDHWRARMDEVRAVARELAARGQLQVTQRGVPLDPAQPWRGAIRLTRPTQRAAPLADGSLVYHDAK